MRSSSVALGTLYTLGALCTLCVTPGCGSDADSTSNDPGSTSNDPGSTSNDPGSTSNDDETDELPNASTTEHPTTDPRAGPPAGYPDSEATIPSEAQAEDVSNPKTVIGTGAPQSCTPAAFVDAVAEGGIITFDCGPEPATIVLTSTAKVFNDKGPKLVIDGGNRVTLSGGGKVRILYMSTCDEAQVYPPGPGDCNTNPGVQLVVQNLTFEGGSAKGKADTNNAGGGGAIYAQGGSLKVVHSRFFDNVCDELGSDVGGGAIRKLDYLVAPGAGPSRPAWIVDSTFGGAEELGNSCANGGALSSIGVSWNIVGSLFAYNQALGHGANDGEGGNGGAIYNDGNEIVLNITSSLLENNQANEGGSAVFFVSNDRSGSITLRDSIVQHNPRGAFETPDLPGFYVLAKEPAQLIDSIVSR